MSTPNSREDVLADLISLSNELGEERRELAILGEGNTSAKLSDETFLVKASGSTLRTLGAGDLVECRFKPLLGMLDDDLTDQQIENELYGSRVDLNAKKPSVEAIFHAYLLSVEGVNYVGHTHPTGINQILCSGAAVPFAMRRLFPDQVVCCGASSVLIPYTDPGLALAREIRTGVVRYRQAYGAAPRVILLENHGVIALGASPSAVRVAMYMMVKAAAVYTGAAGLGGPRFLEPEQVKRIGARVDEHYRQRAIGA